MLKIENPDLIVLEKFQLSPKVCTRHVAGQLKLSNQILLPLMTTTVINRRYMTIIQSALKYRNTRCVSKASYLRTPDAARSVLDENKAVAYTVVK